MNVPGSNLLDDAFTLICPETFAFYRFTGITTNDIGLDVASYDNPVMITGSVQAVERQFYDQFGLDFTKRHIQAWSSTDIDDLYRGRSGDQVGWDGRRWEVVGEAEWFTIDGWNSVIAVEVVTP